MLFDDRHYLEPAAAYVRGRLGLERSLSASEATQRGLDAGLRLHRFKRSGLLPRVKRVLGALQALGPSELLDVGSGRGAFLWPLLDAFAGLPVTSIDADPERAAELVAVSRGGLSRFTALRADVRALPFGDGAFDGASVLEVLEHLEGPERAVRELLRVSRRFVIASVPSHEDDNAEHLQLFDPRALTAMFENAGARRVSCDYVLNHLILIAMK